MPQPFALVPKRKYQTLVCYYFLCPGLSRHYISLFSLLRPLFIPSSSPTIATENERLSVSGNVLGGGVSLLMLHPSPSAQGNQGNGIAPEPHTSTI